jgi:adenylate cyclase
VDWEAEGLLEGLEGEEREARADLLDQLCEAGVPVEELKKAVEDDRLALLPVEHVLGGTDASYTRREVAEKSGLSEDLLAANWRALGLPEPEPDEKAFSEREVEAAKAIKQFVDAGLPEDGIIEVARVMGRGLAQTADAVRQLVGEAFIQPGDTERDLGLRYADAADSLGPLLAPQLEYVLNLHLREWVRNDVVGRAHLAAGKLPGAEEVAICFADLTGFTKLGERLPPEEISALGAKLADLVTDVSSAPVRLIKELGDGVMLVSPETEPLIDTALALVRAAGEQAEDFPDIHAGLAHGPALNRRGDWYGRPVNMASRVCDVARPASVLATAEVRQAAEDGYHWSSAGRKRLKGMREPVRLFRVRSADGQSGRMD